MRDIKKIIADAGGPKKIAAATEGTERVITAKSVYDWPQIGVPWQYWPVLIKLAKSSANEILEANKKARGRQPAPKKSSRQGGLSSVPCS